MRHISAAMTLAFAICLAAAPVSPGLAAQPAGKAAQEVLPPGAPATPDVLEYIRLFGYRQALVDTVEQQLDSMLELAFSGGNIDPAVLDLVRKEFRPDIEAATDRAVRDMVPVFQRYLTADDVKYLVSVGRDPRMQKVVALQTKIAEDMEPVTRSLAEDFSATAGPKLQERLKALQDSQPL